MKGNAEAKFYIYSLIVKRTVCRQIVDQGCAFTLGPQQNLNQGGTFN